MALQLTKSKSINLTKSLPKGSVDAFTVGLAWDQEGDLDASLALLAADGKAVSFVYYAETEQAGCKHSGDARDGHAGGDDEVIKINLKDLDPSVVKIVVGITSYVGSGEPLLFGAAANPVARLYNGGGEKLVEVKCDEESAFGSALELASLELVEGEWIYKNISEMIGNSANGFVDFKNKYER